MLCSQARVLLSAYHDGALDPSDRDRVATHVASCDACNAQLRDLARIGDILRSEEGCELPTGLSDRVARAVWTAAGSKRRGRGNWLPRFAAAAAGFVFYVSLYGAVAGPWGSGSTDPPDDDAEIEQLLYESGRVLAGHGLIVSSPSLFDSRPESHLVDQFAEEATP